MSHKLFNWIVSLFILIFAVPAYIIPVGQAPLPGEAGTTAASTLQATFTPQSTATALQSLIVITPSATPTSLPTNTFTPTHSVPMLTIRDATNCRTGPGKAYELIALYPVNQTLEIVGRYEPGNFWLVKSAESPTGTCWLWGEFVDVVGSYWAVSSVTPPPTPVASITPPAQALPLPVYEYYCVDNTFSFKMTWEHRSDSRVRYRVFRDGWPIAELPAGSTTYSEIISMPVGQSVEYYVQVYNATGSTTMPVIKVSCL